MESEHYSIHVPLIDNEEGPIIPLSFTDQLNRNTWNWAPQLDVNAGTLEFRPVTLTDAGLNQNLYVEQSNGQITRQTTGTLSGLPAVAILNDGTFCPIGPVIVDDDNDHLLAEEVRHLRQAEGRTILAVYGNNRLNEARRVRRFLERSNIPVMILFMSEQGGIGLRSMPSFRPVTL